MFIPRKVKAMKWLYRAGAAAGVWLLLFGSVATGFAQQSSSGDSSVSITGNATDNYLAVQITAGNFAQRPYSFTDQLTTGSISIAVTDTRGTNAGWGVNISGSTFSGAGGAFSAANLGLVPGAPQSVSGACGTVTTAAGQSAGAIAQMAASPARIWTANSGSGAGCFLLPVSATLKIPGETLIGDYTSRVTVSIAAAP
jgi:hypothetical protein